MQPWPRHCGDWPGTRTYPLATVSAPSPARCCRTNPSAGLVSTPQCSIAAFAVLVPAHGDEVGLAGTAHEPLLGSRREPHENGAAQPLQSQHSVSAAHLRRSFLDTIALAHLSLPVQKPVFEWSRPQAACWALQRKACLFMS